MARDIEHAQDFVDYALWFKNTEYHYGNDESGGDDPIGGMDCSGFVTEVSRGVGLLRSSVRYSAQMFYDLFILKRGLEVGLPDRGELILYGKGVKNISHIAICLNERYLIEAGGGTRTTKDSEEAARRNAFVRQRPVNYRKDFICYADPFLIT